MGKETACTRGIEGFMSNIVKYGSPALIQELSKTPGLHIKKEEVFLRDYPDLESFLKQKEDSQKESENLPCSFK